MLITTEHFKKVRGMSNRHWGWGLEDDEFFARLKESSLEISRPEDITTDRKTTFKHFHPSRKRHRDMQKCYNQRDLTRRRDWEGGFDTLQHEIKRVRQIAVDGSTFTLLNIRLICDRNETPYCDCTNAPKTESPRKKLPPGENIMPWLPKRNKAM